MFLMADRHRHPHPHPPNARLWKAGGIKEHNANPEQLNIVDFVGNTMHSGQMPVLSIQAIQPVSQDSRRGVIENKMYSVSCLLKEYPCNTNLSQWSKKSLIIE